MRGVQRPFGNFLKINPFWCSALQWPDPKEFQTLIGAAPSAVSYQISSSWLCYQLAGAPSMAVNQAKATSADQTISW